MPSWMSIGWRALYAERQELSFGTKAAALAQELLALTSLILAQIQSFECMAAMPCHGTIGMLHCEIYFASHAI